MRARTTGKPARVARDVEGVCRASAHQPACPQEEEGVTGLGASVDVRVLAGCGPTGDALAVPTVLLVNRALTVAV